MRIAFVGGGTGGHFYPLIAVAESLSASQEKPELYYVGPSPYEPEELKRLNIKYIWCPAGKLSIYFTFKNFLNPFLTFIGIFVAVWKLYFIYPDVIFSKGSYTSVPVLLAAWFLRIPVVIHESDVVPGRANKLAKKFAKYIAISYDDAIKHFDQNKTALVGIPIRATLKQKISDPFEYLGIPNDLPLIYVTGGSLGAERMNNLILRALDELLPNYRIFHQTGSAHQDELITTAKSLVSDPDLKTHYYIQGNLPSDVVSALLQASSLVITRAGSTTLAEIALHGKPSIVIPIPEDISRDQLSNAYAYARTGAATVIEEHNLTENLLVSEINSILNDKDKRQNMSQAALNFSLPDAAEKIADILIKIGDEHKVFK
ncbi:MAG: UDP-N-acetylglucosamine--N-acetylmuramyl-(pentapeptide) pyrophosphoryl-undecaprenol N-acetylglucosamine transferase [Candidatus Paceibacterota bacterium]